MRPPAFAVAAVLAGLWTAGCAETLPEQDRRIYGETPVAKLSADILSKDYRSDAAAADRQYWGKAVEVSGNVTAVTAGPPHAVLTFGQEEPPDVEATLLDDEADAIVATVKVGGRLTLRCYCEGLDGSVRLRSCIER